MPRNPLSAPGTVRAVAVYDHHPPRGFGVGFRDGEPALAHRTARDDPSALGLAECVAVDSGGPVRFSHTGSLSTFVSGTEMTRMLEPQVDEHGVNGASNFSHETPASWVEIKSGEIDGGHWIAGHFMVHAPVFEKCSVSTSASSSPASMSARPSGSTTACIGARPSRKPDQAA